MSVAQVQIDQQTEEQYIEQYIVAIILKYGSVNLFAISTLSCWVL